MAKGKKSPSPKSPGAPALDDEVAQKVSALKSEGNNLFAQKDWARAIESYEAAMKMLPQGHSERSDLLCNKAACLMGLSKFKDAVKECSAALEATPSSSKALRSRAKALEKQGLYKQALADVQAVNRSEFANDDSKQAEKRLKDLMAARRPSLANGGARAASSATSTSAAAARGARSPAHWPFTAKVTLGNETRLVQLTASAGYGDLLSQVAAKFPNAGPVLLRYIDGEGDPVTITGRDDLQAAFTEALKNTDKRLGVAGIPPIRVQATPVASQADVPPIPLEELAASRLMQQQMAAQQAAQAAAAAQQQQQKQVAQGYPSGDVIEIDDWLVDLIQMIKETAGLDPDKHIDLQNDAFNALAKATDTTIRSEEAQPLFDKAAARFQEIAANGYAQWSQVHIHKAHRLMDLAALSDTPWSKELEGSVKKEFDSAEALLKKSLDVKADYFDALSYMAALESDRAKAAAKLLQKPMPPVDPAADQGHEAAKAQQEAATAATREALAKIKAGDVKSAGKHMASATKWHEKAKAAAEAVDAERKAAQRKGGEEASSSSSSEAKPEGEAAAAAAANGQAEATSEAAAGGIPTTVVSHTQIMHGNTLYEWSQMLAAVGDASWKSVLDEAAGLFRTAGCAEKDIRAALKNHTEVDKLDLGPDPEPEPEPEPTPAPAAAAAAEPKHKPAPEAKGLPKLERKPKEKAAAAAAQ